MNRFLSHVMCLIRQGRSVRDLACEPEFTIWKNTICINDKLRRVPIVWFPSRGCSQDRVGSCTMCNYGAGPNYVAPEYMIKCVRAALNELAALGSRYAHISPSGSMFDEAEVPAVARDAIFDMVRSAGFITTYSCETRADTISIDSMHAFRDRIHPVNAAVEVGIASANPWIRKNCINKIIDQEQSLRAIETLKEASILPLANVILKPPFLSELESINDAVSSVKWALDAGYAVALLFPMTIKRHTLVHWLWERGQYQLPKLWSVIEVLYRIGPDYLQHVSLSWLDPEDESILARPSNCPKCTDSIHDALTKISGTRDYRIVEELRDYPCECKQEWLRDLHPDESRTIVDRVAQYYTIVGQDLCDAEWWTQNQEASLAELDVPEPCFPQFRSGS